MKQKDRDWPVFSSSTGRAPKASELHFAERCLTAIVRLIELDGIRYERAFTAVTAKLTQDEWQTARYIIFDCTPSSKSARPPTVYRELSVARRALRRLRSRLTGTGKTTSTPHRAAKQPQPSDLKGML